MITRQDYINHLIQTKNNFLSRDRFEMANKVHEDICIEVKMLKADKMAIEVYGEFGFDTCSDFEKRQIMLTLNN